MIRNIFDRQSTEILVCSLVISHLDYANENLFGISEHLLDYMQRKQNFAARVVLRDYNNFSSKQALYELHWLPICAHIIYKILSIVFKCLNDANAPVYLRSLLGHNNCDKKKILQSGDREHLLVVPYVKNQTFAHRFFSVCGPKLWNKLLKISKS